MTPERWQQIADAIEAALEVETEQRGAFLDHLSTSDPTPRREVESLLAEDALQANSPPVFMGTMTLAGKRIGAYQIVDVLGEGGMGVVYEAEQEQPRRAVALKVLKPGLASPELLRRFEGESEALARLHHPGIAQIYAAGTAETSLGPQPFFAMELVRGAPLREYAQSHHLNTRERLELIARVCDAVEHAHQRGIIHRDLKPSNILIEEDGQPKILDFGVARVTDSDVQATRQTDVGQLIGTLAYMSPEQVLADPLELDTRSDVYAIGVILYELLADKLPHQLSNKLHEAVRTIREEDPARLSSMNRAYRGDVETIVAKALEKDKGRRYSSAVALATDIRRYLADEPIMARPASTIYQLRKFARRHKALVTATATVFAVLVAGVVVSTREALRARRAEQTSQAVNDFLQNDLLAQASASTQASPSTKPDPDLKVRTALDRAAARIGGKFEKQPEVEAAIRETIGQTYRDVGSYSEAHQQLGRALDLYRRSLGEDDQKTLRALDRLAFLDTLQGRYAESEALGTRAVATMRQVLGAEHPDTLGAMNDLAVVYSDEGKFLKAEAVLNEILKIQRRVLGPKHRTTLRDMVNLASVYWSQGRYAQAEALQSQTLELQRHVLGPEHPETLISMSNLGGIYFDEGKYAGAEALDRQVLDVRRRLLGPEHLDTLMSMTNLANVYGIQGKYEQAEALERQTLDIERRVLGPEHPNTLLSMCNLAYTYEFRGNYGPAEALFNQTLEISGRVLGSEHPSTLACLSDFASMYQRQGNYRLAETHAEQALLGLRRSLGPQHPDTITAMADLALAYLSQRRFIEAEPLAREVLEFNQQKQPDDWQRFRAESLLGASLAGQKKFTEAEPLLLEGYNGMLAREERIDVPDWYHIDRAHQWLVQLYQAWGKPEKAAEWRRKTPAAKQPSTN